jgi:hypothetical protein
MRTENRGEELFFFPCVSVFVFWPPIGRLRYTDKTYARSAAGGSGGRSEVEAAYAAGNEPRSTPPGDAEMNATDRRTTLRLKRSVKGRWLNEQKGLGNNAPA